MTGLEAYGLGLALAVGLLLPYRKAEPSEDSSGLKFRWLFHAWLIGCAVIYSLGAKELIMNIWNFSAFNVVGASTGVGSYIE